MYPRNDDRVCSLGIPSKKGKAVIKESDLKKSRLGGQAVWHDVSKAPRSLDEISCRVCSRSENMALVAKIYAPTDIDRSLYVFCCNTRACSLQSQGWLIVRNQCANDGLTTESSHLSTMESKPTVPNWSALLTAAEDEEDDLDFLLNARNASVASTAMKSPPPPPEGNKGNKHPKGKSKSSNKNNGGMKSTLPQPAEPIAETSSSISDDELLTKVVFPPVDLEEVLENYSQWDLGGAHEDELLRKYLNDEAEDDVENLEALRAAGIGSSIAASGTDPLDDEEEDDYDEEGEASIAGNAAEQYFTRRVASEPKQVLRYAYEGQPLWISDKNPISKGARVPVCESCGSERVYECQLMPALLSHLTGADPSPEVDQVAAADRKVTALSDILGSGIDFGVVAIFSCPKSCTPSQPFAQECAIVQPPPDICN